MSDTEFLLNIIFVETIASAALIALAIIIGLVRSFKRSDAGDTISALSIVFACGLAKLPLCYYSIKLAESYGTLVGLSPIILFGATIYVIVKLSNNKLTRVSKTTTR